MRLSIFFLFVSVLIFSCSKSYDENSPSDLRIHNISNIQYDSVLVNAPGGKQVYGPVSPGSFSGYKPFLFLYNYAYIEVHFNNQVVKLQPLDYVGEEKLKPGKYRYELKLITGQQNSLVLECKRD
jgi:hypothetical protein